jgi:ubiquinone/menaquinone biosynthesis C-methylase UbiE
MGTLGKFDTDAAALANRVRAHDQFSALDLNQWCFELLAISPEMSILELGCGTGKQSLAMARLLDEAGRITALDISAEALEILRAEAAKANLSRHIETRRCDLDEIARRIQGGPFDRVIACYSIYYAKRPEPLFQFLHSILRPGGVLFFCGPSQQNNAELKAFHDSLYQVVNKPAPEKKSAAPFMEGTGQELAKKIFGNAEIFTFDNPLRFNSAEALYSYWSSYNLYDETLDEAFRCNAAKHFQNHPVFETVKRVIGVRTCKNPLSRAGEVSST